MTELDEHDDPPLGQFNWYAPWQWSRVDLIVGAACLIIGFITLSVVSVLVIEWLSRNTIFS